MYSLTPPSRIKILTWLAMTNANSPQYIDGVNMKIIRWQELKTKIGLSRSTIWRMMQTGKFPKHVQIGPNSVGWYEHEVIEFMESLRS